MESSARNFTLHETSDLFQSMIRRIHDIRGRFIYLGDGGNQRFLYTHGHTLATLGIVEMIFIHMQIECYEHRTRGRHYLFYTCDSMDPFGGVL